MCQSTIHPTCHQIVIGYWNITYQAICLKTSSKHHQLLFSIIKGSYQVLLKAHTCGSSPTSSSETFSFSEQDLLCGENNQTLFPSKTSNDYHLQLRGHSPSYPFNYRNNQLPETQTLTLAQSSEQLETNFLDQPNGYYFQPPYHTSQPELIPPPVDCSQDFQLVSVKNLTTFYIENNNQEISGYVSQHECGFSHPLFELSKNKENELNCSFLLSSGITWWVRMLFIFWC